MLLLFCIVWAEIIVQTQLLEGYATATNHFNKYTGIRVVFHLQPQPQQEVLEYERFIIFQPLSNLSIIMDIGNSKLETFELVANQNVTLLSNPDAYYYSNKQRYLLHLDMDIYHKLKHIEINHIMASHPSLSTTIASNAVVFIKSLLSGSIFTTFNQQQPIPLVFNHTRTQINSHLLTKRHVHHYRTIEVDPPAHHLLKRANNIFADPWQRLFQNTTQRTKFSLSHMTSFITKTLGKIGVSVRHILSFIKDLYHWEHVKYVQQVMVHYCKVIKNGIFESIDFVDLKLFEHYINERRTVDQSLIHQQQTVFDSVVVNKSTASPLDHVLHQSMHTPYLDARSSFIEDLLIQNVHKTQFNTTTMNTTAQLHELGLEFFHTIDAHMDVKSTGFEALMTQFATILTSMSHQPILVVIKQLWMQLSTTLHSTSITLVTKLFQALMSIFKRYINLYWQITHTKLHIPLVSDFLHFVFHITDAASMLDGWTTMGAMLFTYTFRAYNNKFPITVRDVNVLTSVKSPYLLVWAWENDPLTGPPSDKGYYKKSCTLDWMTKALTFCARLFSYSLSRIAKEQASLSTKLRLLINHDNQIPVNQMKSNWDKNITPYSWGVVNWLFSFNNYLSANLRFPFDYLQSNDVVAIREQMRKPDRDRWLYWIIRYPRTLFYTMRPFLEGKYRKTQPLRLELFKFVVNGMLKWLILPRNIVDLYLGIDIQDTRRFQAWAFTSTYWLMSMFGDLADLVVAYFNPTYYKTQAQIDALPKILHPLTNKNSVVIKNIKSINDYTDTLSNLFCFLRYNTYIGYKMSGWYATGMVETLKRSSPSLKRKQLISDKELIKTILTDKTKEPITRVRFLNFVKSVYTSENTIALMELWRYTQVYHDSCTKIGLKIDIGDDDIVFINPIPEMMTIECPGQSEEDIKIWASDLAEKFLNMYVKAGASNELNLSSKVRDECLKQCNEGNRTPMIFNEVKESIVKNIIDNDLGVFRQATLDQNINKEHRRVRLIVGIVNAVLAVIFYAFLLGYNVSQYYRLLGYPLLLGMFVGYFQWKAKFCVAFSDTKKINTVGFTGMAEVTDEYSCKYQGKRSKQIKLKTILCGTLVLVILFVVPPYNW